MPEFGIYATQGMTPMSGIAVHASGNAACGSIFRSTAAVHRSFPLQRASWKHVGRYRPGRTCGSCGGRGCWECDDTGWEYEGYTPAYVCFQFVVGGTDYIWHVPDEDVTFPVVETQPPEA